MWEQLFDKGFRPVVLALGGTGVIGGALGKAVIASGNDYVSLSLSPTGAHGNFTNICFDLSQGAVQELERILASLADRAPILALVDVIGLIGAQAQVLANLSAKRGIPLFVVSSCLLYDHAGAGVVSEDTPSIQNFAQSQAYQERKRAQESFWQQQDLPWRILRTHHVLGRGALLGCIPAHNRDPQLLSRLRSGKPLQLVKRGEVMLSYIHPQDFARAILRLLETQDLLHEIVNLVHPEPVQARRYYEIVARQIDAEWVDPEDFQIDENAFWASTGHDNVFASRFSFVRAHHFLHDISACIKDALSVGEVAYPEQGKFLQSRIKR